MSCTSCQNQELSSTPINYTFRILQDITLVDHSSTGYHSVDFTSLSQIKVLPGDLLTWLSSDQTGKIAIVGESLKTQGQAFDGIVNEKLLGPGLQNNPFYLRFALGAKVVPLSSFNVGFKLDEIGNHPVVLTLRDGNGNQEVRKAELITRQPISGLLLNIPEYALVGKMTTLTLNITNSTNVTYHWQFGKNRTKEIFETTSVTHTFTSTGTQKVSVTAFNDISWAQIQCFGKPYVLHAVEGLKIPELSPVKVNQMLTVRVLLAQGTLVDLNVSLGDNSSEFSLSSIDEKYLFTLSVNHSYSAAGVFTVRARAENALSNATAQRNVTVQWPIVYLDVRAPQGIQSTVKNLIINVSVSQGSDVLYKLRLNREGNSTANKTASGSSATVVFPRYLLRPGAASLEVTAYNLVSSTRRGKTIVFVAPISEGSLVIQSVSSGAVETKKPVTFTGKFETGSNVSAKLWILVDGKETIIERQSDKTSWVFIFPQPGVYTARVNFSNLLGNEVVEKEVIVQNPVKQVQLLITDVLISLPPGDVRDIQLQVSHNEPLVPLPTNATIRLSFDDGSADETSSLTSASYCTSHR